GLVFNTAKGECELENRESCSSKTDTTTQFPIDCATGQKRLMETDYRSFGSEPLVYTREYVSPIFRGANSPYHQVRWSVGNLPSLSIVEVDAYTRIATFRIGNRVQRTLVSHIGSGWQATHSNLLP